MTQIIARHDSILKSRAAALVVCLPSDGVVLEPTLTRLFGLYPDAYHAYKSLAQKGELTLGEVHHHLIQKQATGLMMGNNARPDHLFMLITQHNAAHPIAKSTLKQCYQTLYETLFKLMRFHHLSHVSFALPTGDSPYEDWGFACQHLAVPRLKITLHIKPSIDISGFIFPLPSDT